MNDTIRSIATIMSDLDGILIFPHINMDGDALGSSTALCLALRALGKKAYIMIGTGNCMIAIVTNIFTIQMVAILIGKEKNWTDCIIKKLQ